ncbi:MAG: DoxX family protein [Mycobacterium sp.]
MSVILQVIAGLGLINVWLVRPRSATAFRGGSSQTLREEFAAYGLPDWCFYAVGAAKIVSAVMLIVGIWVPRLVLPATLVVAVLMVGALAMHAKVKDPLTKSVPAFLMLAMVVGIALLR